MSQHLDALKRQAAERAVDEIQSGMVIGLGHGSTADHATRKLGQLLQQGQLQNIVAIPASRAVEHLATELGIPLTDFAAHPKIDLTIDGADEVDPHMNLIKGGGGALLREKIIAQASLREIIIVDHTKMVPTLGSTWALPVEVVPFGWESHRSFFSELGAKFRVRKKEDGEAFHTDQGNLILDCNFGPMQDVEAINQALNARSGVVEHGLFLGLATKIIVASPKGLRILQER